MQLEVSLNSYTDKRRDLKICSLIHSGVLNVTELLYLILIDK